MTTIPVRIRLEKLFCYHGDDESDSEDCDKFAKGFDF